MDRVEKFTQTIANAREESERKRLEALPMDAWWDVKRHSTVKPVLSDAAKALNKAGYHGVLLPKNGSGWLLRTGANERSPHRHLAFALSGNSISITSSEVDLDEVWDDRGYVTEENVEKKVEQFIQQIVER